MKKNYERNISFEEADYQQIDITEHYKEAIQKIEKETKITLPLTIKDKIYPTGVSKITYSPQTETIYYYQSADKTDTISGKSWEVFEDRGASFEKKLISSLSEIQEIKTDYDEILKEEIQIERLQNDQLLDSFLEFIKTNGTKEYRYRLETAETEKCKVYVFNRANITEEIILFSSDKKLVLSRILENGKNVQKNIQSMNRTVITWYYEGVLRQKRLDKKQKYFQRKQSI